MSDTSYAVVAAWNSSNRYTASGSVSCKISNTGGGIGGWGVTVGSDTAPTIKPSQAHPVGSGESDTVNLVSGDRLWLVAVTAVNTRLTLGVLDNS